MTTSSQVLSILIVFLMWEGILLNRSGKKLQKKTFAKSQRAQLLAIGSVLGLIRYISNPQSQQFVRKLFLYHRGKWKSYYQLVEFHATHKHRAAKPSTELGSSPGESINLYLSSLWGSRWRKPCFWSCIVFLARWQAGCGSFAAQGPADEWCLARHSLWRK